MYTQEILELVCDITFKTLVREGKSLQTYIAKNCRKTVEEAVEVIQYLDAQQTICTKQKIEQNYQGVLQKILF